MAVQYNSKNNSWGGFIVDIYKAKKGIVEVSDEATKLFDKYKDKNLSNTMNQVMSHDSFDNFIKKNNLADESLISFLQDTKYSEKTLANYQLYLKNSANSTTLFSRVTKTAGSALKKLCATLGSMVAMWAIGEVIGLAITGIDNYIHRVDNAKESLDEFNSSVQEQQDSLKSQKDWIDQNGDRYSTLAKGVDEYGHNVSLTKDEFVEYNKITSEIADMFPDMVKGYNDQNNALIKNKGNVDALTEAYKKNQDAYYADIRKDAGETFSDFKTGTQKSQKDYNDLGDFINGKKNGYDNIKVVTGAHNSSLLKNSLGEENYKKLVSETTKMIKNGDGFQFDQLSEELQLAFRAAFSKVRDTIETESEKVRPILTAYLYGNASGYDDLSQDAQDAVQSFVQNVDSSFFEKFDTETDMESWIKTNVINPLKDGVDNEDLAVRIKTLFSLDEKDFKTHKEYVDAVMDIIDTLSKVVDKDGKKVYSKQQIEDFKQQLGVSDVDDEGNVVNQKKVDYLKKTYTGENTKSSASNDVQNWYDQLSSADYKLATSSEFETALKQRKESLNGAALSADDYAKALDDIKSKEQDTTSDNKLISFEEAWNNLKSVGEDAKDVTPDLLALAKSGELSDKTLKTTSEYQTLLTDTGLSAKEVRARIGEMLSEQEKMSGFKTQLQSIASAYNEFKDKKFVTAETLEGLPDVFKEINNGKSFDIFSKIVGDPKSGKKKIKEAFNDLVTEYANSQLLYQKVTSKNRDSVVANLKDAGVTNAGKVVDDYIAKVEKAKKYYNMIDDADDEFTKKSQKNRQDDLSNFETVLSKKNYSYNDLVGVVGEDNAKLIKKLGKQYIEDYKNWLKALDAKATAQERFNAAFSTDNSDVGDYGAQSPEAAAEQKDAKNQLDKANKVYKKQKKIIKKLLKEAGGLKLSFGDLDYSPKDKDSKNKDKDSSSKQTIDWIERALNRVSSTLDLIKAKAENLFGKTSLKTLQKQEASLKSQYNILKKQYSYQEKAEKKYLAKANSIKLSSSLKKAVREGRISGSLKTLIATYGEKTATKIQDYQDYWDKAQDQKKNKEETKQAMRQNQSDRYQLHIDDADARKSRNEAELENLTTAKAKESVLKNTLTHIRTSYNYQIKQAKLENDDVKVAELKAQKQKELRETEIQILQNYADEYEASVSLLETQSSSTTNLGKKNSLIQQSLTPLKNQYAKLIAIAKKEGDITEQKRLQAEYQDKLNEKLKTQFDNVADAYEFLQSGYQQKTDSLNNRISLSEAQGHYVGQDFYYNVMSSQKTVQTNLKKERDNLISKRAGQVKQGLSLDSNEYREMTQKIWELDRSIEQGETDIANTAKQIREAKYAIDEFTQSRIDERNNEAEFYKTIMEYKDAFDDNGIITSEGLGILTADVFEIQNYTAKVQEYKDSLADLQKEYNAGGMGYDEFITKNQELTESMRDAQSQVYSMRDAMKSLIEEGLNAQLSALNELIDKYKETLNAEKDLRDYNKTVEEQTKNISTLQKQISALSGDTSEEGRARVQKLQVSLNDAKQQLEDTEYDKRLSDIENIFDDLSEDYQDFMDDQMDHIDDLVENIITAITVNSGISGEKIKELSELFGITLSDSLLNFIDKGNNTTNADANSESDTKTKEDRDDAAKALKDYNSQQQTEQKSVDAAKQAKADAAKKAQTESKKQTTNNTKKTKIGTAAFYVKDGKVGIDDIGKSGTLKKGATYYDYALSGGIKKGDKGHTTKSAHSVTIAAIDNNGNIKLKSKNNTLNGAWIPKNKLKYLTGFSTGGRVGDLQKVAKMNGDDGVTINTLKKGEEVLTPYNADLFDKFVGFLPDLVDYNSNLVDMIKPANVSATKMQTGDLTLNIDNIELPNVTDPKEFSQGLINAMKQDKKLQRFWGDATAGSLNNNMSGIYKY